MSLSSLAKTLCQGFADAGGDATAGYPFLVAGGTSTDVIRRMRVTDDGRVETVPVSSTGGQMAAYVSSGVVESGTTGTAAALNAGVTLDLTTVKGGAMSDGVAITTSGTWVGTITYYGSYDGTNFVTLACTIRGGAATGLVSTRTVNATVYALTSGLLKVRAEFSAYTSGTATIQIVPTSATGENGHPCQMIVGTQTVIAASGLGDAGTGSQSVATHPVLYNSATFDRARNANGAANTSGAGVQGIHAMAYDGTNYQRALNLVGSQGNAWSAAATGAGGVSTAVEVRSCNVVSFFGNSDGATTFTIQASQDNTNYYDTSTTVVLAGAGNFGTTFDCGYRYVKVKSSNNVTVTATVAGKGC